MSDDSDDAVMGCLLVSIVSLIVGIVGFILGYLVGHFGH